jgi:hypothetical protein
MSRCTFLPELSTIGRKQVSSVAGLAPRPREPGQWKGENSSTAGERPRPMPSPCPLSWLCGSIHAAAQKKPPKKVADGRMCDKQITLVKTRHSWTENKHHELSSLKLYFVTLAHASFRGIQL